MEKSNAVKMALIVGGSQGIGRSLVEQFADHGWRVIEASRNVGKDEANILHDHVDLGDVASIDAFADRLRDTVFDLIHLNAGMVGDFAADARTVAREAIAELFYVNAVGPLRLAKRLLPLLREDGVVAFTTSDMASMATYDSLGLPLYRASKAALNSLTRDFYLDASQSRPITVLNLHPGWVRTRLGAPAAPVSPEESARGLSVVIGERRDPGHFSTTRARLLTGDGVALAWGSVRETRADD
jgi:NAD(P)-dependent dehydrogenase (short-subunit alcohol dehydrogenase family)